MKNNNTPSKRKLKKEKEAIKKFETVAEMPAVKLQLIHQACAYARELS